MSDTIRDLELQIFRAELKREEIATELKEIEKRFAREIEALWATDKDPQYSNAAKRTDACKARLAADPRACELDDEKGALEIQLRGLSIDLSFHRREFQRDMIRRREAVAGIGDAE